MKGLSGKGVEIPSMEEITQERKRLSYRRRYKRVLKSTVYALVVVAAVAVLLATNLLPVLQVSGDSMNPTLQDQDILVLLKTDAIVKVLNKAGTQLPSTGGIGTTLFYVIGGGLMAVAAVLLVAKKRMNNK